MRSSRCVVRVRRFAGGTGSRPVTRAPNKHRGDEKNRQAGENDDVEHGRPSHPCHRARRDAGPRFRRGQVRAKPNDRLYRQTSLCGCELSLNPLRRHTRLDRCSHRVEASRLRSPLTSAGTGGAVTGQTQMLGPYGRPVAGDGDVEAPGPQQDHTDFETAVRHVQTPENVCPRPAAGSGFSRQGPTKPLASSYAPDLQYARSRPDGSPTTSGHIAASHRSGELIVRARPFFA